MELAQPSVADHARERQGDVVVLEGDLDRQPVVYDLGEVRGLDYYTGGRFELFTAGAGRSAGTGGRYDALMARFGEPMSAVGVSLDLDTIAEVLAGATR